LDGGGSGRHDGVHVRVDAGVHGCVHRLVQTQAF
jgi:hypothetical protein